MKQELNTTCHSIALSLDLWTSETQLAILGVMGHRLTADFEKEKLLEFIDIERVHSGENFSEFLVMMLEEFQNFLPLRVTTPETMGHCANFCRPHF